MDGYEKKQETHSRAHSDAFGSETSETADSSALGPADGAISVTYQSLLAARRAGVLTAAHERRLRAPWHCLGKGFERHRLEWC